MEYFDEYYDPIAEQDAWQETIVQVKNAPCPKCKATKRHTVYNNSEYSSYDTICDNCGYLIISLLD